MKQQTLNVIAQQGYSEIFAAIHNSIRDLKQAGYYREEIKETIMDSLGVDDKTISFINKVC